MDPLWWIVLGVVAAIVVLLRVGRVTHPQVPPGSSPTARPTLGPEAIREIDQLVAQNLRIKAIKVLREHTRLSLQDAKTVIDEWTPGALRSPGTQPVAVPTPRPLSSEVATQIDLFVTTGKKIEAIKLLREHTGSGLKDAKEAIDHWIPGTSHR